MDYVGLSFLVGNHDAHGKNYSLLYLPDSAGAIVAPAYDMLSTIVYDTVKPMSRKMAMKIGREYRPAYVRARHLDGMFDSAGLGIAAARRRLGALARSAPEVAADARRALADDGWDSEVLARIAAIVAERARWLEANTAPKRAASRSL